MLQDRICRQCGRSFTGGPRAWYCPDCRKVRARRQQRERKCIARRPLGSMDICQRCGKPYTVTSSNQKYCPACQPIHAREYDRKTSLEFYQQHADKINPKRYVRRKVKQKICIICGKPFDPHGVPCKTCSEECRAIRRREIQRKADAKRSPRKRKAPQP